MKTRRRRCGSTARVETTRWAIHGNPASRNACLKACHARPPFTSIRFGTFSRNTTFGRHPAARRAMSWNKPPRVWSRPVCGPATEKGWHGNPPTSTSCCGTCEALSSVTSPTICPCRSPNVSPVNVLAVCVPALNASEQAADGWKLAAYTMRASRSISAASTQQPPTASRATRNPPTPANSSTYLKRALQPAVTVVPAPSVSTAAAGASAAARHAPARYPGNHNARPSSSSASSGGGTVPPRGATAGGGCLHSSLCSPEHRLAGWVVSAAGTRLACTAAQPCAFM